MKLFTSLFALLLSLLIGITQAGETREVVLKDGSVIAGEIISLNNGIYTVKSDSLGTIKLEETKVRTIRERSSAGNAGMSTSGSGTAGEVRSLQEKMMGNQEVMNLIQSLQNDAEFKKLLEDPEIMKIVNAGDIATLMADPRFIKLLNNPTVREIQRKVK